eukprot:gene713-8965_t
MVFKVKLEKFKPSEWSAQWPLILLFIAYVLMLVLGLAYVGGFIFKFVTDAQVNRNLKIANVLGLGNSVFYVIAGVVGIVSILVPIAIVQIFLSGAAFVLLSINFLTQTMGFHFDLRGLTSGIGAFLVHYFQFAYYFPLLAGIIYHMLQLLDDIGDAMGQPEADKVE